MFKIISKSKYEAMLTQIEGLKVICENQGKTINLLRRNNSIKGDKIIRLVKEKDTISSDMKFVRKVIKIAIDKKTILENRIKELSDELSKWKRNRDLVTGRFIKNRK